MSGQFGAEETRVAALCGGVGGAKLAQGLARCVAAERLSLVVNTADDFERYGLAISPDVDTVLYTLAGVANPVTGWGLAGDTDRVMSALGALGDDAWFHLGDRDLATHLTRTAALRSGRTPTEVTRKLADALGVGPAVLPMTDDTVATVIETEEGPLPFQEWFVRRRCTPPATAVRYEGATAARPTRAVVDALAAADMVLLCPSNPYLSIGPILALAGVRDRLRVATPVVAVSPIVGGAALKGPAAHMLSDLDGEASSRTVARRYADFLDGLVVDEADAHIVAAIEELGVAVLVTRTVMGGPEDRTRLAREVTGWAAGIVRGAGR